MSKEEIINEWKVGKTVQQIAKSYATTQLKKGFKIKPEEAQHHVEEIIFNHLTNS